MRKEELLDLRLYLQSGNAIPVERVTLPADKFQRILDHIDAQAARTEALAERLEKHIDHRLNISRFTPKHTAALYCDTCLELIYDLAKEQ